MRRTRLVVWLYLALKLPIALLVICGAANKELAQWAGKGMGYRLFVTPAALAVLPA